MARYALHLPDKLKLIYGLYMQKRRSGWSAVLFVDQPMGSKSAAPCLHKGHTMSLGSSSPS